MKNKIINKFDFDNCNKEDLAYIVGAIMGDGCVGKSSISICSIDLEFLECIREKILKLIEFKKKRVYIKTLRKRNIYLIPRIYSKEFTSFMIKKTANKTKVPDFIMNGNNNIKINFINGLLDAEGSVPKNMPKIYGNGSLSINLKSKWIFDVKKLLKDLNIKSNRVKKIFFVYKNKYDKSRINYIYLITINATSFIVNGGRFVIKRKQERLEKIKNATYYEKNSKKYIIKDNPYDFMKKAIRYTKY